MSDHGHSVCCEAKFAGYVLLLKGLRHGILSYVYH